MSFKKSIFRRKEGTIFNFFQNRNLKNTDAFQVHTFTIAFPVIPIFRCFDILSMGHPILRFFMLHKLFQIPFTTKLSSIYQGKLNTVKPMETKLVQNETFLEILPKEQRTKMPAKTVYFSSSQLFCFYRHKIDVNWLTKLV